MHKFYDLLLDRLFDLCNQESAKLAESKSTTVSDTLMTEINYLTKMLWELTQQPALSDIAARAARSRLLAIHSRMNQRLETSQVCSISFPFPFVINFFILFFFLRRTRNSFLLEMSFI
jgi:hypothetical protein